MTILEIDPPFLSSIGLVSSLLVLLVNLLHIRRPRVFPTSSLGEGYVWRTCSFGVH